MSNKVSRRDFLKGLATLIPAAIVTFPKEPHRDEKATGLVAGESVFCFISLGCVDDITDKYNRQLSYITIDLDLWEMGNCPVCHGQTELIGAVTEEKKGFAGMPHTVYIGGHQECVECGATEGDEYQELIDKFLAWEKKYAV